MPRVAYLVNAGVTQGVGQYAVSLRRALASAAPGYQLTEFLFDGTEGTLSENGHHRASVRSLPGVLGSKSVAWVRLARTWRAVAPVKDFDIVHATNQTLSFTVRRRHPSVVTVHDIIEILEPQSRGAYLLNRHLYSGIVSADHLIAVSQFTARSLADYYTLPRERISVIYNGVGSEFQHIPSFADTVAYQALRHELKISPDARVVLYVGSDHPRKNVITAVRAFARALRKMPRLIFIKVGEAGLPAGREALLAEIDRLKIRESVRFVGTVTAEKLNELYNLANVFVYPSRFEGFGLPPLEAMAAGVPVVASNATSLPEVVGDGHGFGELAALVRHPDDEKGFADDVIRVLEDASLARDLRNKGIARARLFTWKKAARTVGDVYTALLKKEPI